MRYPSCASCKYNRARCKADCLLAPYFPSHMIQQYKNAHKVFGESHLKKLLRSLPPRHRSTAKKHIVAEADNRAADPVGGTYGLIRNLQLKIAEEKEELRRLRNVLGVFRGGGRVCVVQNQGNHIGDDQGYYVPVVPLVPGGFLQTLLHQELGNVMFDLRDAVLEHGVMPIQGEVMEGQ